MVTFASETIKKQEKYHYESFYGKYILLVAPLTTPKVVRELSRMYIPQ